ncbi:MAG TPA: hypothetical protein VM638_07135, partial [Actinomycetota bacterium]|nr:hypothetical protein [Actinomycetota bacterium]
MARAAVPMPSEARMREVRRASGLPALVRLPAGPTRLPEDPLLRAADGADAGDFSDAARHLDGLADALRRASVGAPVAGLREDARLAVGGVGGLDGGWLGTIGEHLRAW